TTIQVRIIHLLIVTLPRFFYNNIDVNGYVDEHDLNTIFYRLLLKTPHHTSHSTYIIYIKNSNPKHRLKDPVLTTPCNDDRNRLEKEQKPIFFRSTRADYHFDISFQRPRNHTT